MASQSRQKKGRVPKLDAFEKASSYQWFQQSGSTIVLEPFREKKKMKKEKKFGGEERRGGQRRRTKKKKKKKKLLNSFFLSFEVEERESAR